MNKIIKISGYLSIVTSLLFASCLKDDSLTLNTSLSNSVVEFGNTGSIAAQPSGQAAPRYSIDLGSLAVGSEASFNVNVDYAGANTAPSDISVTVDIDDALLAIYDSTHSVDGANYIAPPSDLFVDGFPMTITIPKGQLSGQAIVKVKLPADYDFTVSYALPLKITSVSAGDISGNFGAALYSLNVRNAYDGIYNLTGTILREADNDLSGSTTGQISMTTTGPYSIQYDYHPWHGGSSVGGIDGLTLTVDPTTNKVTVSSLTNPALVNLPSYDNRYDPTSRTYYVSYYWGAGPSNRAATDTLVYAGPR
ncbi:MAG: DUF1735 domain-containing protein [Parafilimonas sp.]